MSSIHNFTFHPSLATDLILTGEIGLVFLTANHESVEWLDIATVLCGDLHSAFLALEHGSEVVRRRPLYRAIRHRRPLPLPFDCVMCHATRQELTICASC